MVSLLEVILTVSEQSYLLNPPHEKRDLNSQKASQIVFQWGEMLRNGKYSSFFTMLFSLSRFFLVCGKTCKAQNGCEELNVIRGISGSAWKLYSVAVLVRVSSPFYRQEKSGIFFGWLSCNTFFIFFSGEVSFIKSQSAGLTFKAIVLEIHTTWISLCAKDV